MSFFSMFGFLFFACLIYILHKTYPLLKNKKFDDIFTFVFLSLLSLWIMIATVYMFNFGWGLYGVSLLKH